MSRPSTKKTAPPKVTEPIVTRHMSAQQGRQLRKKDRSMKSITQLLKSPNHKSRNAGHLQKNLQKTKRSPAKKPKSPPKASQTKKKTRPVKKRLARCKELHPEIVKRNVSEKKMYLKPKYEMKVIARANKRKLKTPQKGTTVPPSKDEDKQSSDKEVKRPREITSFGAQMTMADFVRLAEEADGLDDDDLMEILTCPSPVWWEDPPDDNYTEDAIIVRIPTIDITDEQDDTADDSEVTKNKTGDTNSTLDIVIKNKDARLKEKSMKLEKILRNIKNKFNSHESNEVLNNSNGKDDNVTNVNNGLKKSTHNNFNGEKSKRDSAGTECEDILMDKNINREELLRDLENINIPIQDDVKSVTHNKCNISTQNQSTNNIIKIKLIDKSRIDSVTIISESSKKSVLKNMKMASVVSSKTLSEDAVTVIAAGPDANIQDPKKDKSDGPCDAKLKTTKNVEGDKSDEGVILNTQIFVNEDKKRMVTVSRDVQLTRDSGNQIDHENCITVYKIKSQSLQNKKASLLKTKRTTLDAKEAAPESNCGIKRLNVFYKKRKNSLSNGENVIKMHKASSKDTKYVNAAVKISEND